MRDAISDNPWDRISGEMKTKLQTESVMFDVHCHIFNFDAVPNGFFRVRLPFSKIFYEFMEDIIEILSPTHADFVDVGGWQEWVTIAAELFNQHEAGVVYCPLMMDFKPKYDFGVDGDVNPRYVPYEKQIEAMERVQKAYPAGVLPFLAVDPRRDNVLELFQRVFAEPTRFFGIKIYPSLGYFPSDPTLLKVFEICEEKNIPVTAHCSGGTVRSSYKTIKAGRLVKLERDERFTTEKRWIKRWDFTPVVMRNADDFAETFNHPRNWEPVLKLFPKLRLNLAHFGGGEQWLDEGAEKNNDWIKTIVEFLENPDYPNVYTDISYTFAVSPAGGWMVGAFYGDKGDLLRDKCLYGSDWYMTMIEGKFKNHLDTFISGVGREAFDRISRDNPRKFLGLDRTDY